MKRLAWLLLCLPLFYAPPVLAEDSKAVAEAKFKEALELAKKGEWKRARPLFEESVSLHRTASGLLNLALAEEATNRPVEALSHARAFLAHPKADPRAIEETRSTVLPRLWNAAGHVRIRGARAAVALDGASIPPDKLGEEIDVSAGKHVIEHGQRKIDIDARAGEVKDVDLAASDGNSDPPVLPDKSPRDTHVGTPPVIEPQGTIWKPLTFVIGGATLLAGAGALYFNAKSHDAADEASSIRRQNAGASCTGAGAPSFCKDLRDAIDDQDTTAGAAQGFWIGAGVLLAATVTSGVLWATSGPRSTGVLAPVTAPGFAGATYRVSF